MNKKILISVVSVIISVFIPVFNYLTKAPSNPYPKSSITNQTKVVINNLPIVNSLPTPPPSPVSLSAPPIKQPSNKQSENASQQMKPQKLKTPIKVVLNCKTNQKVKIKKNFYVWCDGSSNFEKRWMREIHINFLSKNLVFDQDKDNNEQLVYYKNKPYRFIVLKPTNPTEVIVRIDHEK